MNARVVNVARWSWLRRGMVGPLLAGLAMFALAVCGGQATPTYPATPVTPGGESGFSAPDIRIIAYQGEEALGGKEVNLSAVLARGRPIVLNFWAGLCPPCRAEMPDFQQVYNAYKGKLVLFGLDVGPFVALGSREDAQALLKELNITYPAGTTLDSQVVRDYQLLAMPTTFFIKPNGDVLRKWTGPITKGKLTELMDELLRASGVS